MSKRILVILGHPVTDSFCGALARAYVDGAQTAGHHVKTIQLGEIAFNPLLLKGYAETQPLEPALIDAQAAITWAQHLVFVYPIWWGAMPALLKGFIDRVFLPGFAFSYRNDTSRWDRLLEGRSAHLLVTMDSPPWYYRWVSRMPGHQQMRRSILEFSGIRPVKITSFGPIRGSTVKQRQDWLIRTSAAGQQF